MGSFSWVICVSSKKSKVSLEGKDDGQRVRQGNVESRGRKWRFQDATLVGSEDEEKSHEPKKMHVALRAGKRQESVLSSRYLKYIKPADTVILA